MGDSLDLVPIGGWRGSGRKSRWISPWLMATYDPTDASLGSVCRVMSGFSDKFYKEIMSDERLLTIFNYDLL